MGVFRVRFLIRHARVTTAGRRVGKAQACPPFKAKRLLIFKWWARREERLCQPCYVQGHNAVTRRWRERPLPPREPRRGFRHASTRRRAAGRTAAPARWQNRTFWSAKIGPLVHPRTRTAQG